MVVAPKMYILPATFYAKSEREKNNATIQYRMEVS